MVCVSGAEVYLAPILTANLEADNPRMLEILIGRGPVDLGLIRSEVERQGIPLTQELTRVAGLAQGYVLAEILSFWSSPQARDQHIHQRRLASEIRKRLQSGPTGNQTLNFAANIFLRSKKRPSIAPVPSLLPPKPVAPSSPPPTLHHFSYSTLSNASHDGELFKSVPFAVLSIASQQYFLFQHAGRVEQCSVAAAEEDTE